MTPPTANNNNNDNETNKNKNKKKTHWYRLETFFGIQILTLSNRLNEN